VFGVVNTTDDDCEQQTSSVALCLKDADLRKDVPFGGLDDE